ncbi:hypothetical protein [Tranquillimonas rosea]|uniref:hypothetical protein n=1 Tax=Tranquillimonas rosea TaxID=641238 RepID=UPI003BA88DA4
MPESKRYTPQRSRATLASIERIIKAGKRSGLMATHVAHHPDGAVVVYFGALGVSTDYAIPDDDPARDWDDV